jgi:hypothetical protein
MFEAAETKAERTPLSSFAVDSAAGNSERYRPIYGGRVQLGDLENYRTDWKERFCRILPEFRAVAFSVILLMGSTATERVTFKMSVDRMTPYRLSLTMIMITLSFFVYGAIALYKLHFTNKITQRMLEFPHRKLFIMALLDTTSFAGLILSAAAVTPTMTVILLHISTPFVVLGSRMNFPSRVYSESQLRGVYLITLAVVVSVARHVMDIIMGVNWRFALSSLMYMTAAAVHGLGTVMKEKAIIEWSQPLDIHYLSAWLFFYQIVSCALMCPLIYLLQGISDGWSGPSFPFEAMVENIHDGFRCFLGQGPPLESQYDVSDCLCAYSFVPVMLYVLSNIVVLECIDSVLQNGNSVLGRAMAAAVLFAFVALGVYDRKTDEDHSYDRVIGSIGLADFISITLLLLGINAHHSDQEHADEHPTS